MATFTRIIIAVIAGGLAVDALATLWTPTAPRGFIAVTCTLAACTGAAGGALLWALRWPTRTQARWFAVVSGAGIALIALATSNPVVAMLTCMAFALMAGHIAVFHNAPLMAYNFAIASVIGAVEGIRMAAKFNIVEASRAYVLLLLLNFAVPFGIQVVVHVLGADAVRACRT